ncbi:MAG: dynamin family protein [Deltaproteobacteria bacterium]|nr:MAG: dynamin family protein [Deltaproteobacteria bacterium]
MHQDPSTQTRLEDIHRILETLVDEVSPLFRKDSTQVNSWQRGLETVVSSLREQILRIAVVGSVKSGKSTFMNAMQGRDLLRRGAGIITAFITRISSGDEEKGWVEIKSWEEINAEINEAMVFVGLSLGSEGLSAIDLRRKEDRSVLQRLLQEARQEAPVARDTFDPNLVLINAYLKGFSTLGLHVGDEPSRIEFTGEELYRHQDFVTSESQAVYLKDMELQLPIAWLGEKVEIGDCQGSDSPNPLHFAMLQEYLLSSHCILYLISSRVGIRQADLKLIEAIKVLRLLPQTLFILNVDLDEHGDVESLERLQERVGEELRLLIPEARLYLFSALLQLFEAAESRNELSTRETRRLESWKEEESLVHASRKGYGEFCADLQHLVSSEQSRVLYGGVLSHLQRITRSMRDSVTTRQGLLSKDLEELKVLGKEIKTRQQSVAAAVATVESTFAGMQNSLKNGVRSSVDSYFDTKHGPIIRDTLNLIENYPVDNFDSGRVGEGRKLWANLYLFYQGFRQTLSRHLIDKVNLRIIDFAKNEEERLEKKLLEAAEGYWNLLAQALQQYQRTLSESGLSLGLETPENLPQSKRPTVTPPPFSAFLQGSDALGRGSLLFRFGLGRLRHFLTVLKDRVFRRNANPEGANERLFREAVVLVKKETQKELITSFRDYRQNFKFMYLFSFIDRYAQNLVQLFRDFGEATMVDIGHLEEAAHRIGTSQQDATEDLAIVQHRLHHLSENLRQLEKTLLFDPRKA